MKRVLSGIVAWGLLGAGAALANYDQTDAVMEMALQSGKHGATIAQFF